MGEAKQRPLKRTRKQKTTERKPSPKPKSNVPTQEFTSQKESDVTTEETTPKPKLKVGLTLNWNRAIHINTDIDDRLLKDLTPVILQMKQESSEPITVGIDSPGGSLGAMQSLLGLLNSPDQDGKRTLIYTASTNRAYSAAASLLAFGDYAVAFPHSRILYHDVRYSGIDDLTPSKALQTARELERGNAAFALSLANHIRRRLIWVYLDLMSEFGEVREQYGAFLTRYDEALAEILPVDEDHKVDVVAFALTLFRKLSSPVDREIAIRALDLLTSWIELEKIEKHLSARTKSEGTSNDIVQGINDLVAEIRSMGSESQTPPKKPTPETGGGLDSHAQRDVRLLLEVLARRFATDTEVNLSDDGLDLIIEDFSFIKDITSDQHIDAITKMIIDSDHLFFGRSIATEIRNTKDIAERRKILEPVYPQARVLWHYIALICKCLCQGEHYLRPGDAQLLGLIDEVLGGGPVESAREWRKTSPDYEQTVTP